MNENKPKTAAVQAGGFVKMMRTPDILELLETSPLAFALAAVIALRARFRPGVSLKGLHPGEAFIGDHEKYGMTRQQYRTAIAFLKKHGFATIKSTTKGTIAKLMDTRLFSVLNESGQPTEQPTANQQPTTNKNGKKGENGEEGLRHANFSNSRVVFPSRFPESVQQVYEIGRREDDACDADVCNRWIRYCNANRWTFGNEPIQYWPKALKGFCDSCGASPHGAAAVPYGWIPEIIPPDDEPAAPANAKSAAAPAVVHHAVVTKPPPVVAPTTAARPVVPAIAPAAKSAEITQTAACFAPAVAPRPAYVEQQPVEGDEIPAELETAL